MVKFWRSYLAPKRRKWVWLYPLFQTVIVKLGEMKHDKKILIDHRSMLLKLLKRMDCEQKLLHLNYSSISF